MSAKERMVEKTEPITHECVQSDRIEKLENKVENIEGKVDSLSDKADDSSTQIARLTDALLPSDMHPDNGIISSVSTLKKGMNDVKEDISSIKQQFAVAKAYFIGGFFVVTIVWALIQFGMNMIEKKNEPTVTKQELLQMIQQLNTE